jgi:CO/xanthine dehydrogenase Mo-binding subunit
LFDELALKLGVDRLEFRIRNALNGLTPTVTGTGSRRGRRHSACLEALRPRWRGRAARSTRSIAATGPLRRGMGVAGMWYGCGNTSLPIPRPSAWVEAVGPRRAASGRRRYRPGLEYGDRADRGGWRSALPLDLIDLVSPTPT